MSNRIQPIPILDFCDKYLIHLDTGVIYDIDSGAIIDATMYNDKYCVSLKNSVSGAETLLYISDILLTALHGYTNSKPIKEIVEYPMNSIASTVVPRVETYKYKNDKVYVNGIKYHQWLETPYYASKYGAIFSTRTNQFCKFYYNDRNYAKVSLFKKSFSVHRVIWETFNGPIRGTKEVDHIDDRRWNNNIGNLQLLTHEENLKKISPYKRFGGKTKITQELICQIGNMILENALPKDIAKALKVPEYLVHAMKYHDLYSDILKDANIDLGNIRLSSKFRRVDVKTINHIKDLHRHGFTNTAIANEFGYKPTLIDQILSGGVI